MKTKKGKRSGDTTPKAQPKRGGAVLSTAPEHGKGENARPPGAREATNCWERGRKGGRPGKRNRRVKTPAKEKSSVFMNDYSSEKHLENSSRGRGEGTSRKGKPKKNRKRHLIQKKRGE